ncbi:hypothetical protein RRF57_008547 [Xylaria bambusicola]|uniref:Uncharacterized protein n=1 Tax=Xylaria bambusicola TaxID=326684 RepID=A0AAN7UN90_9PEZI
MSGTKQVLNIQNGLAFLHVHHDRRLLPDHLPLLCVLRLDAGLTWGCAIKVQIPRQLAMFYSQSRLQSVCG